MRRARSFRSVAVGAVTLGAVVLGIMFALYLRYVHYERVAANHLPEGTVLAVRVDVEQAIFYEPIRRHILPLFGGPGGAPSEADARLSRIEVRSRLKRGDLREIVVGRGTTRSEWVVVLGGIFPGSDRLVTALADEPGWTASADGQHADHAGTGVAVARADDGAVVIASSQTVLASSLPASGRFEALGLPTSGAGGFALSKAALGELARWAPVLATGELTAQLDALDLVTGRFTPGERIRIVATFHAPTGRAAETAATGVLELMRARSRAGEGRENVLLRGGADRAAVKTAPTGVELASEWERPEVDYALAALSDTIRSRW